MSNNIPPLFSLFNQSNNKNLVVVFQIAGVPDILSSASVGTYVRYGDQVLYGQAGLVYGGLRPYTTSTGGVAKSLLALEKSSLSITQSVEPEQGRASISQISATFLDLNGYMTNLCTPGKVIPDILGAQVNVYLGYAEISFPSDYYLCFRRIVQGVSTTPGMVTLQLGDRNLKRRQDLFFTAQTVL